MKKTLSIISFILALTAVTSCDWFTLDNQDGWDAKVEGALIDSKTGEPVQSEQQTLNTYQGYGTSLSVIEKGWDAEDVQYWNVKSNGTYVNKLVFAGDYTMDTKNANFVSDPVNFTLKKGNNTVNFTVTPFMRVLNPKVSYDPAAKKIVATCTVEGGLPAIQMATEVRLCCFTDRFVSNRFNNCSRDAGASVKMVKADGATLVTISIDTQSAANANEFKYKRAHYVRIAALGSHPSNAYNRYNYSPVFKIGEDFNVTEVTDW